MAHRRLLDPRRVGPHADGYPRARNLLVSHGCLVPPVRRPHAAQGGRGRWTSRANTWPNNGSNTRIQGGRPATPAARAIHIVSIGRRSTATGFPARRRVTKPYERSPDRGA
ncbi:hypothetical protein SFR_4199 [Streptomyces sp. FR-008]|nr:hypothetical protein SFR_4199 [Streptomyces sp. FR-008]